jgi:carbonic anhydrase
MGSGRASGARFAWRGEYGIAVFGVRALLVLGHGSCGAVSAAIAAKEVPGQISTLYRHLRPAVDQVGRTSTPL